MSMFGCFFSHTYIEKIIPGRPHISSTTGDVVGRDGDIIKRTCTKCGFISFLNLRGTPRDEEIRRRKFCEILQGKRKYYHV